MSNYSFWDGTTKAVVDTFYDSLAIPDKEFQLFKTYIEGIDHTIDCDNIKGTCKFNDNCDNKA
jgi:hypothetical protein